MNRYYIFNGAEKEKPGSGFIEKEFKAEGDESALELARRHYENPDHTLWSHNGVNGNGHIQFRFVAYINERKKNGSTSTAG